MWWCGAGVMMFNRIFRCESLDGVLPSASGRGSWWECCVMCLSIGRRFVVASSYLRSPTPSVSVIWGKAARLSRSNSRARISLYCSRLVEGRVGVRTFLLSYSASYRVETNVSSYLPAYYRRTHLASYLSPVFIHVRTCRRRSHCSF